MDDFSQISSFRDGNAARSQPFIEVGFANPANFRRDPDKWQSAFGSPISDGSRLNPANIVGGGFVGEDVCW